MRGWFMPVMVVTKTIGKSVADRVSYINIVITMPTPFPVLLSHAISNGDPLDFSVGYSSNATNHADSTGLATTVTFFLANTYALTYDY